MRALTHLHAQAHVLAFFEHNLGVLGHLESLRRSLRKEWNCVRKPCTPAALTKPKALKLEALSEQHPNFVFHKTKRFFSESLLEGA